MKKNLITLAVASTLATAVVSAPAFADTSNVNVYGVAHVSYDLTDNGVTGANKVSSNQSRFGLKGSEDLGDGLSAVWQIEQNILIDNSTGAGNGLATRNTFLGLSSTSMGTALLGRHDTPYKSATRGLDVFADTIADNRSLMGIAGAHDIRATDIVVYTSPAMSGFTASVAYVAGSEAAVGAAGEVKGNAWSMAGMYGDGPIKASLAYQKIDNSNTSTALGVPLGFALGAGNQLTAWKLGGGYTMDAFTVNAAYENTGSTNVAPLDGLDRTNWYLGGKYSFGNDAVKLAYTRAGDARNSTTTGATQWSLGYDHNLSKRTALYAVYTKVDNEATAAYGVGTGVTTGAVTPAAGNDPRSISFGMKHTF